MHDSPEELLLFVGLLDSNIFEEYTTLYKAVGEKFAGHDIRRFGPAFGSGTEQASVFGCQDLVASRPISSTCMRMRCTLGIFFGAETISFCCSKDPLNSS